MSNHGVELAMGPTPHRQSVSARFSISDDGGDPEALYSAARLLIEQCPTVACQGYLNKESFPFIWQLRYFELLSSGILQYRIDEKSTEVRDRFNLRLADITFVDSSRIIRIKGSGVRGRITSTTTVLTTPRSSEYNMWKMALQNYQGLKSVEPKRLVDVSASQALWDADELFSMLSSVQAQLYAASMEQSLVLPEASEATRSPPNVEAIIEVCHQATVRTHPSRQLLATFYDKSGVEGTSIEVRHKVLFSLVIKYIQTRIVANMCALLHDLLALYHHPNAERNAALIISRCGPTIDKLVTTFTSQHEATAVGRMWNRLSARPNSVTRNVVLNTYATAASLFPTCLIYNLIRDLVTLHIVPRDPQHRLGVGLYNNGNTCYLNSALQCVVHLPLLKQHLLTNTSQGEVYNALVDLVRVMHDTKGPVSPAALQDLIHKRSGHQFPLLQQHDAHEWLTFLLDSLHEELNAKHGHAEYRTLPDFIVPEYPNVADIARVWWESHVQNQRSLVQSLFHGQGIAAITCHNCEATSYSCDPIASLSLALHPTEPLPPTALSPIASTLMSPTTSITQPPTFDEPLSWDTLLTSHFHAEHIPDSYCTKCKVRGGATRTFLLHRLPYYLIVVLKRFRRDEYGRTTSKDSDPVHFPLEFAIPKSYMSSSWIGPTEAGITRPDVVKYELIATVHHIGDLNAGHYVAICRGDRDKWRLYNDSVVSDAPSTWVADYARHAYVLVYRFGSQT